MSRSELAHLELLAEVDALVASLHRWADDAPPWLPADKCQALVRRLSERAGSLRVRLESPLIVAMLGGTGVGKSALVNAILGAEVVQTGRQRPTTTRPTIICRPNLSPDLLGIDPSAVELIQRDLPALRELVLVDCPDPDTTEEPPSLEPIDTAHDPTANDAVSHAAQEVAAAEPGSNLARLRAILPKCDVLLVVTTQQKYRSARVAKELTAAACGAHVLFVQTHAEIEDDIRSDWRGILADSHKSEHIFLVDSLRALADAQAGLQPRGEFASLLDCLTRQLAGAAANRIRRVNFLELVTDTLQACRTRIEQGLPAIEQLERIIVEQRNLLGEQLVREMQAELLASRRQWEQRLLAQTASQWGFSPFSLVLRVYQGLGAIVSGVLLSRVRTPAQIAIWGALQGARTWRKHCEEQQAAGNVGQSAANCWTPADLRKSMLIVQGYADDAGLNRETVSPEAFQREAAAAAGNFVGQVSNELDSLISRQAKRHVGWFTRWRYDLLVLGMLVLLLYRLGKNFFYDSWWVENPSPIFGLEFYGSAIFWLILWCLILLWAFFRRLRQGLSGEIDRLAERWRDHAAAAGLFAGIENSCQNVERFHRDLVAMQQHVADLSRQIALPQNAPSPTTPPTTSPGTASLSDLTKTPSSNSY
jgi:hypothetical protein